MLVTARAAQPRPSSAHPPASRPLAARPTPERLRHGALECRRSAEDLGLVVYENRQPLLLDTMLIADSQRAAGLLLRELYVAAGMMPRETHNFDSWSFGGGEMGDRAASLRRAFNDCLRAVPLACRGPLSDLCCHDRAADPRLTLKGLQALAAYIGRETRLRGSTLARFAEEIAR